MDKLERLAGQLAHDFDRLIVPENEAELLEAASRVTQLTDEFTALQQSLAAPEPGSAPTILVVDGEPEDRAAIRALLAGMGCAALEAAHGAEALEICERFEGPIAAMLTNVLMPDMSGRELAERAAALRPEMAVLYMSGYTTEEIMFYGVLGPGLTALQKPLTAAALAHAMEAQLALAP